MKRTMMYLPDDLHKDIKRLAVERETSVAAILREALEALREEDIDDLNYARNFLNRYKPGSGSTWEDYKAKRDARSSKKPTA